MRNTQEKISHLNLVTLDDTLKYQVKHFVSAQAGQYTVTFQSLIRSVYCELKAKDLFKLIQADLVTKLEVKVIFKHSI